MKSRSNVCSPHCPVKSRLPCHQSLPVADAASKSSPQSMPPTVFFSFMAGESTSFNLLSKSFCQALRRQQAFLWLLWQVPHLSATHPLAPLATNPASAPLATAYAMLSLRTAHSRLRNANIAPGTF
eukprot:UN3425